MDVTDFLKHRLETRNKIKATSILWALDFLSKQSHPEEPHEFLEWLFETHLNHCKSCYLHENRNFVVKPDGQALSPVMIVLEKPGFLEDLTRVPLTGLHEIKSSQCTNCLKVMTCFKHQLKMPFKKIPWQRSVIKCEPELTETITIPKQAFMRSSGSVFDGLIVKKYGLKFPRQAWIDLAKANFPHSNAPSKGPWFITNSVLCRPVNAETGADSSPESTALKACNLWLTLQWAACQPKVVIGFGKISHQALWQNKKAKPANNILHETIFGPSIANVHPAAIMRYELDEERAAGYASIGRSLDLALQQAGLLESQSATIGEL